MNKDNFEAQAVIEQLIQEMRDEAKIVRACSTAIENWEERAAGYERWADRLALLSDLGSPRPKKDETATALKVGLCNLFALRNVVDAAIAKARLDIGMAMAPGYASEIAAAMWLYLQNGIDYALTASAEVVSQPPQTNIDKDK